MKEYGFEDYLEEVFNEQNPGILDDDLENAFDNWLSQLDGEEYIRYADTFALKLSNMHIADTRERINEI